MRKATYTIISSESTEIKTFERTMTLISTTPCQCKMTLSSMLEMVMLSLISAYKVISNTQAQGKAFLKRLVVGN